MKKQQLINRSKLNIANIPRSYFLIGSLIILISLTIFISVGVFIKYSDEYKSSIVLSSKDVEKSLIVVKNIPPSFLKNLKEGLPIKMTILNNNKNEFRDFMIKHIDISKGIVQIALNKSDQEWLNNMILRYSLLNIEITMTDLERNLLSRLLEQKTNI